MLKRKWWIFLALILLPVEIFFLVPYIKNTDFSHSEIEEIPYQNVTKNLETLSNTISFSNPTYSESDFDFSQVPKNFTLKGKSYMLYPYSDEFCYSVTPVKQEIPNKIKEDFEIAKKLTIDFAKKCNFSNDLISKIEDIPLKCGDFTYMNKISSNLFIYYDNAIYAKSIISGNAHMKMYTDEEFVQMFVAELLKVLQEQTFGRRICSYFNDYLSSTIAAAIVGIEVTGEEFKPILAFIKAVGSSKSLESYFFGFDSLINDGKIKECELELYMSIVQVLNSSLGGQSEDLSTYKTITGLSEITLQNIEFSLAAIWNSRN